MYNYNNSKLQLVKWIVEQTQNVLSPKYKKHAFEARCIIVMSHLTKVKTLLIYV